jgi:hypothetical protein
MLHDPVHQTFTAALDALVAEIKNDRSILAAILCGSLSHDIVWAKSDIDLVLVTMDGKKAIVDSLALYAGDVNVHAMLMPRAAFRKTVEGSIHQSFMHSFLAKGRLLYTHDPSIADLFGRLSDIGDRDTQVQLLRSATSALGSVHKAHKWLLTRGDLEYSALWILYAATPLAQIEIISRRLLADREVLPQAMRLNPEFFETIYTRLLNTKKTPAAVEAALSAVDAYLARRTPDLFGLVLDHLRETGEPRSGTDLDVHFARHFDVQGVTIACEYLADQGWLGKASVPVHLTKSSNVEIQELAFFYTGRPADA